MWCWPARDIVRSRGDRGRDKTGGPRACARLFPYRWNALQAERLPSAKFKITDALERCRALRRRTFSRFCYSNQPAKRPVRLARPQRENSDSQSGNKPSSPCVRNGSRILGWFWERYSVIRAGERRWLRHTIMLTAAESRSGHKVTSSEEEIRSAVSWAAIIAGAVAATAATVTLLVLSTGVGVSIVSPWYGAGASAALSAFRRWCGWWSYNGFRLISEVFWLDGSEQSGCVFTLTRCFFVTQFTDSWHGRLRAWLGV
jgi:hypothetical protein